jgi:hypothetical protein
VDRKGAHVDVLGRVAMVSIGLRAMSTETSPSAVGRACPAVFESGILLGQGRATAHFATPPTTVTVVRILTVPGVCLAGKAAESGGAEVGLSGRDQA